VLDELFPGVGESGGALVRTVFLEQVPQCLTQEAAGAAGRVGTLSGFSIW